jgi:Na+-transporting NADH:ubiquinone oxidoreductase subunit NqrD
VDYVVESGVTLRAVGDVRFKKFVVSLTNGYEPSSIRTILRRIVKLYRILEPLLTAFLCNLDVAISLMLDSWSNRNLKGFYVVTAH